MRDPGVTVLRGVIGVRSVRRRCCGGRSWRRCCGRTTGTPSASEEQRDRDDPEGQGRHRQLGALRCSAAVEGGRPRTGATSVTATYRRARRGPPPSVRRRAPGRRADGRTDPALAVGWLGHVPRALRRRSRCTTRRTSCRCSSSGCARCSTASATPYEVLAVDDGSTRRRPRSLLQRLPPRVAAAAGRAAAGQRRAPGGDLGRPRRAPAATTWSPSTPTCRTRRRSSPRCSRRPARDGVDVVYGVRTDRSHRLGVQARPAPGRSTG